MKTLLFFLLTIMMYVACTKEPIEPTNSSNPKNVNVTIDYAFPVRSGSMVTKSQPTYLDFYTKYIVGIPFYRKLLNN